MQNRKIDIMDNPWSPDIDPDPMVRVIGDRDNNFYLINTEGFDYPRYLAKLPDYFKKYGNDSKYADLFNEHTLKGMYESLKKQYSNKH